MSIEPEPVPQEGNPPPISSLPEDLGKISLANFPVSVQDQFRRLLRELKLKQDAAGDASA